MTRLSLSEKDNENPSLMEDNDRIFVVEKVLVKFFPHQSIVTDRFRPELASARAELAFKVKFKNCKFSLCFVK